MEPAPAGSSTVPLLFWRVLAVALVAIVIPMIWFRVRRAAPRGVVRFSSVAALEAQPKPLTVRLWFLPALLRTAAVLALAVALWRPQSLFYSAERSAGIAIQMVMDVSGSMGKEDFEFHGRPATRLDAVKQVFRAFVMGAGPLPGRASDMIGLTAFAQYADVKCPLTLDHTNLINVVDQTNIPADEEKNWTALGDAMALTVDQLRKASDLAERRAAGAKPAESTVAILLTDGRDNPDPLARADAPDPVEAARIAAKFGIRFYTIGAGSDLKRRFTRSRDMFGAFLRFNQVGDEIDEATLKEIARITGGKYFRATDAESLRTIYQEIDQLERIETGEKRYVDRVVIARWSMALGLALLTFEAALVNTRFRRIP